MNIKPYVLNGKHPEDSMQLHAEYGKRNDEGYREGQSADRFLK